LGFPNLLSIKVIFTEDFNKASKWLARKNIIAKAICFAPKKSPDQGDQSGRNAFKGATLREGSVGL
jgi:hypothetical protein